MLVATFLLYGGLYQVILRCRFCFWLVLLGDVEGRNLSLLLYPLCSRARQWYGIAARSKDSLSDEMSESRLLIDSARFLIITGGWLDLV